MGLGPTAFFFLLSLTVALAAPDPGTRIFYLAMTLSTGYWLVRSLRVGVEVTPEVVAVHGQLRNRRFALEDIRGARGLGDGHSYLEASRPA